MEEKIIQYVNELFESIPYFQGVDNIKEKIIESLKQKYYEELKQYNETQAFGRVLFEYSDIKSVGILAGYSQDDIERWTNHKTVTNTKTFQKLVKTYKRLTIVQSILIVESLHYLISCFYSVSFINTMICLCLAVGFSFLAYYINKKKPKYYALSQNAFHESMRLSDCYNKRSLNSLWIFFAMTGYAIFFVILMIFQMKLSVRESMNALLQMMYLFEISLFLVIKNNILYSWLNNKKDQARQHKRWIVILSVIYWIMASILLIVLRNQVSIFYVLYNIAFVVYGISWLLYVVIKRKEIVYKNIVIHKKRIAICSLVACLVFAQAFMKMDRWLLQPYISSVSAVEYQPDIISYNEQTGVYSITTDKEDFKVLQLTDIHLGGSGLSLTKDHKALKTVKRLIDQTQPDFIVVTGDLVFPMGIFSYSLNNTAPITEFIGFMRNIGIPWAFLYGNHDTEDIANGNEEDIKNIFISSSYKTSRTLLYPYKQPDITGRNNQMIEIKNSNGTLRQALFLLDSNDYIDGQLNDYDYIHDDQVDWYRNQIQLLKEQYGQDASSLMFFHMPLQEYKTAYELYEKKSPKVQYQFGSNDEKMIDKVCCSDYHSKIFDAAVELKSTKAMFCGHDHYNNMSLIYQGIQLTYGMSIDYLAMPGISEQTKQRGATLITLSKNENINTKQIK